MRWTQASAHGGPCGAAEGVQHAGRQASQPRHCCWPSPACRLLRLPRSQPPVSPEMLQRPRPDMVPGFAGAGGRSTVPSGSLPDGEVLPLTQAPRGHPPAGAETPTTPAQLGAGTPGWTAQGRPPGAHVLGRRKESVGASGSRGRSGRAPAQARPGQLQPSRAGRLRPQLMALSCPPADEPRRPQQGRPVSGRGGPAAGSGCCAEEDLRLAEPPLVTTGSTRAGPGRARLLLSPGAAPGPQLVRGAVPWADPWQAWAVARGFLQGLLGAASAPAAGLAVACTLPLESPGTFALVRGAWRPTR